MTVKTNSSLTQECWPYIRPALQWTFGLGFATNLLALSSTWYMLEVYDRVIASLNFTTLLMLTLLIVGAYFLLEVLEWIRHGLMKSIADWLEDQFAERLYEAQMSTNLYGSSSEQQATLQDLNSFRSFLTSNVMIALLDIPYALIVLIILVFIHPLIAAMGLGFALLQALSGWMNDRGTRDNMAQASSIGFKGNQFALSVFRNAHVVQAMGMSRPLYKAWQGIQDQMLEKQAQASIHAGVWTACSKWIQTLQSSLLIGLGCLLTLEGVLNPNGSMIIVGSVLGGRLMTPLAQLIPQWRQVIQAQTAWTKLAGTIKHLKPEPKRMSLPAPSGELEVSQVVFQTPPGPMGQAILLRGIHFRLEPGETLCVLGPSGSGKSTLARLLIGLISPVQGSVRLDGADLYAWPKEELGPHIGYLPPQIELLDGTIAQNIARFSQCDQSAIEQAAQTIGLHELITQLPLGYETPVGQDGTNLSGGTRQRVGLARALLGWPKLLVLDEPNASLDEAGNTAFLEALEVAQKKQCTVIVISHRTDVVKLAHKLLILREGQMQMYGPTQEVINKLQTSAKPGLVNA
jgi:ATP-binding cassette subfamily C exporter for protease/lipase